MQSDDLDILKAMLSAARRIVKKTEGLTFEQFNNDEDILDICAMQCQIIGNSADSLSVALQQMYPSIEWEDMYGMRCAIAHSYGTTNFSMKKLWNSVRSDVPELIERLEVIIEDLESGENGSRN